MAKGIVNRIIFVVTVCVLLLTFLSFSFAGDNKVFPSPKQVDIKDFKVNLDRKWYISICGNDDKITRIAAYLEDKLSHDFYLPIGIRNARDSQSINTFIIGLANEDTMKKILKDKGLSFPQNLGTEGYLLEVYKDCIIITANTPAGIFYGIQSMIRLISKETDGRAWITAVSIKDYPGSRIRGVFINAANLDKLKGQIDYLAGLKINFVIIENWAFFNLQERDNGAKLAEIFEYARERFIEPVPHLNGFSYAGPVLSKDPYAAEGIWVEDAHFKFVDDEAAPLGQSRRLINVIRCEESNIAVKNKNGNMAYIENEDYKVIDGTTSYPYLPDNEPARIVRLNGGRIRDGEEILVSYDYVEKKTASWANWVAPYCPSSERTYRVMFKALEDTIETLNPKYISIGHDEIFGMNRDSRCRKKHLSNAGILAYDINKLYDHIKILDPDIKVMMWDDMLNPWHNGGVEDMQVQFGGETGKTSEAIGLMPKDIIMLVWWYESADKSGKMENSPAYFESKRFDYIVAGYKEKINIKKWADLIQGRQKCLGIIDTVWEQFENSLDAIRYTAEVSWD